MRFVAHQISGSSTPLKGEGNSPKEAIEQIAEKATAKLQVMAELAPGVEIGAAVGEALPEHLVPTLTKFGIKLDWVLRGRCLCDYNGWERKMVRSLIEDLVIRYGFADAFEKWLRTRESNDELCAFRVKYLLEGVAIPALLSTQE